MVERLSRLSVKIMCILVKITRLVVIITPLAIYAYIKATWVDTCINIVHSEYNNVSMFVEITYFENNIALMA